jgi:hypothetical protein
VHQYRATNIPKDGQLDFPSGSLCLEFFVGRRQQVLPLHRLSLTLWFIMVHPGLVSCHSSMEKSISFTSITVQMLLINGLPCTLLIIGQLPWDPSATHWPIPEVIRDNIVCRAMTPVEFYGNFINSDLPVVLDSLLHLLFHCLSCHANWSASSVFITEILSSVLKSFHPFIHSPLTQTTVSILNLHSSVDFRRFHTLWPQKTNNTLLLFQMQVDIGAAMLYELSHRLILLDRHDPYMAYC